MKLSVGDELFEQLGARRSTGDAIVRAANGSIDERYTVQHLGSAPPCQLMLSKCSIKVSVVDCCEGASGVEKPTAHASFGASTAFNSLVPLPTFGFTALTQFVPFQRIARLSLKATLSGMHRFRAS
jgi:hypothetical protein